MIKARVGRLERILGGVVEPFRGTIRIAPFYDDEPIPVPGQGEDLILINIIRTPPPPPRSPDPTNGGGAIAEDALAAEVARLELERDSLKARTSEGRSGSHPRRAVRGDGFRDGRGANG